MLDSTDISSIVTMGEMQGFTNVIRDVERPKLWHVQRFAYLLLEIGYLIITWTLDSSK